MKILLFGTGEYYQRYKKWFAGEEISALLDNDLEKQNTMLDGIQILTPEEGICLPYDRIIILSFYVKQMKAQLRTLGVPEKCIYHFYDLHDWICDKGLEYPVQYYENAESIVYATEGKGKKMLLLSHDLTLGGPAIALLHAAEVLIKNGFSVIFASMLDGAMREILSKKNIPVIIDVNLQWKTMEETPWAQHFDAIICNTNNFFRFLSKRNTNVPVLWWLHDSAFFYDGIPRDVLCGIDWTKIRTVSVGPVPRDAIREIVPDIRVGMQLYGVADTVEEYHDREEEENRVVFVTIGYIEARKGQDILLDAIKKLPSTIRKKAVFYLIGQDSSQLAKQIKEEAFAIPEIKIVGTLDRKGIDDMLMRADVMVCPSREDPMPTVAAEAMMHGVPCVVSDAVGTAAYIEDGRNGYIFQSENIRDLAERLLWCIDNKEKLKAVGAEARKRYECTFSMNIFEKEWMKHVEALFHIPFGKW